MRPLIALSAALLVGCGTPDELPEDLLDLTEALPGLFRDFEGDDAQLVEYLEVIEESLASRDDLAWEGDEDVRRFLLDPLPHEGLDVTTPPGTSPDDQLPVVAFGVSRHDFDTNLPLRAELNQVCIESNTTVYYRRTFTEGGDCLVDGSCDISRSTNEVRKESLVARAWYDLFKDFKRLEMPDGRRVILARSWSEEVFEADGGGGNAFKQTFTAEVWLEDGATTKRVYAIWPEIVLGLPDDGVRSLVADGLDENMANTDDYLDALADGEATVEEVDAYCPNDRDATFERE